MRNSLGIGALVAALSLAPVCQKKPENVTDEFKRLQTSIANPDTLILHTIQEGESLNRFLRCEGYSSNWRVQQDYYTFISVLQDSALAAGENVQRVTLPDYILYTGRNIILPSLDGDKKAGCK